MGAAPSSRSTDLGWKREAKTPTWAEFFDFETYVFDCDGVIWGIDEGDTRTSVETINYLLRHGKRTMFITNNSNKTREDFVRELEQKGIRFGDDMSEEAKVDMMISASYTTAQYLKSQGLRKPFVITSDVGLLQELKNAGVDDFFATVPVTEKEGILEKVANSPEQDFFNSASMDGGQGIADVIQQHTDVDCIVVGWDMSLTARKIATAVNFIKFQEDMRQGDSDYKEMPIISCSSDAGGVFRRADIKDPKTGEIRALKVRAVGNGAMAEAISRCFDPPRSYLDMGKPSDCLIKALESPAGYHVNMSKALMVGDTLQTDIVFGNRGGMKTLLVLSGVTTENELKEAEGLSDASRIPDFFMSKLGAWYELDGSLPPREDSPPPKAE